jgi:hypothetical protein
MNAVMALFQFTTIAVIILYEYKRKSISIFLWATLMVMFGVPHLISVLFGLNNYEPTVTMIASMYAIMFNIAYLATRIITTGQKSKPDFIIEDSVNLKTNASIKNKVLVNLLFISLLASTVITTYYSQKMFGGILDASWGGFYTKSASPYEFGTDIGSLRIGALYLLFASGGVLIALWFSGRYASAVTAMALIIYYSIITRNRIAILPLFVSLIIMYMMKNRKVKIRQIIILGLAGILIVYAVYALLIFRHYGTIREFFAVATSTDFNRRIVEMILDDDGELGLRNVFYYFISENNQFPNFGKAHSYIRLLLIGLPTKYSLGLKPNDFAIAMGSAYANDYANTTYSTHPTLYGDCYANLGWYGILLAAFWALFVSIVERLVNRKNAVTRLALMVLYGCTFVIIGRGSIYNGAYIGFIGGLYLLFWDLLLPEKAYRKNI